MMQNRDNWTVEDWKALVESRKAMLEKETNPGRKTTLKLRLTVAESGLARALEAQKANN